MAATDGGGMLNDPVSEELRVAEREIDSHHLANPLMRQPFAKAGWYFLAFLEETKVVQIVRQDANTAQELAILADILVLQAKWPLKWLSQTCLQGGAIPRQFDADLYTAAWQLSELSTKYLSFEAAFSYATFGLVTLTLEGNGIKASGPMWNDARFDAYDRLTQPTDLPLTEQAQSFLERVAASVRVKDDWFDYDLNPPLVQSGLESLGPIIDGGFVLPRNWELPNFTLRQFGQVARVLKVLAIAHFQARMTAVSRGCQGLGIARALILTDRAELVRRLCRYSGVAENATAAIVDGLTYGAHGQSNPDPALQPIVPLSSSKLAMPPNLLIHSSMERNLSVLLNRLPDERLAYAALSQGRETLSRDALIEALSGMGFRFWYGHVPNWGAASEIDFAIVSESEQQCLLLELKSFIAPAEPREVRDRSEEIRHGIEQVRDRMNMAQIFPSPLRTALGIDDHCRLTWAVASETSIGSGYVQSSDVPVVKTNHLIAKLRQDPKLATCCRWLENRHYLPTEGVHYQVFDLEASVGKWTLQWYGIKDLVDAYV
jgi:hypothetical protein